jgi:hypothetical protein
VAIDIRMRIWLETVPTLLQRLDIKHVAIVTHSAGAVYTLNTLFHHRSLLDPKAPYVAFLGSCPVVRISLPKDEADNSVSALGADRPLGRDSYRNRCQTSDSPARLLCRSQHLHQQQDHT